MPCKTRQAALRGERSKPHYYLTTNRSRMFVQAGYIWGHHPALQAFEARIDWSTWGRSR